MHAVQTIQHQLMTSEPYSCQQHLVQRRCRAERQGEAQMHQQGRPAHWLQRRQLGRTGWVQPCCHPARAVHELIP